MFIVFITTRFGGTEFPPMIYFKIFTSMSNGMAIKYLSGKRMIQPASEVRSIKLKLNCELSGTQQSIVKAHAFFVSKKSDFIINKHLGLYSIIKTQLQCSVCVCGCVWVCVFVYFVL